MPLVVGDRVRKQLNEAEMHKFMRHDRLHSQVLRKLADGMVKLLLFV